MSSEGSQTVEIEALSRKAEAIERESTALVKALGRARRTRQCLSLVVVVLIVAICALFYRLGDQFRSEQNTNLLLRTAEKQLAQRTDLFLTEVRKLADHSAPVLAEAFSAQSKKDMPKYGEAFNRERAVLLENLQERLKKQVQAHQKKVLDQHEAILKEEFPQFDDKKLHARMLDNMQIAMTPLVQKYYIDELGRQLQDMYDSWDEFPVAGPVRKGDPPLEDVPYGQLLELLTVKLSRSSEDHPQGPSTEKQPAADKKNKPESEKKEKADSDKRR